MYSRIARAAAFDPGLYEEVEHDTGATGEAALIIVLAAISAGIGGLLRADIGGLISEIIWGLIGYMVFSAIVFWIGMTFFRGPQTNATLGQVLRTIGYANSPALLSFLTFIPVLGWALAVIIPVWILGTATIAVRAALDFSIVNAFATVISGWVVWFIVRLILRAIF